jgi:hypothetical protein
MKNNSVSRNFFSILLLTILITACSSPSKLTPSSEIQVIETDSKEEVIPDIVLINNCGGTADTEQTATRSFSTNIEGEVTLKATYEVIEGSISAKYGESRNTSKSIKLVAPPGTNMEFTLQWTEQTWIGRVMASGESGDYVARMPISVAQVEAKNLGCISTDTPIPNWAISFEYQFPSNPWSVGMHEYTIENSCPNVDIDGTGTHSASHTQTFEVSESAAVLQGNAYLRISGLTDKPLDAQLLENIKPLQTTIAVWTLIGMTQEQAELAVTDCTVTVSWDGGTAKQLQPGLPFQR